MTFVPRSAQAADPVAADIVVRGGLIYDGTGSNPFAGDVAVRGDRLVAVGRFEVAGSPEIVDAAGCCVAPGFIDLHNHSDRSIVAETTRANPNFLRQGCTTIVTGNCGGGAVDVEKYLLTVEKHGAGTNVVHLIPQGDVRDRVMGKVQRPPTAEELEKMRQLVDKGMREGAFGMSTGLIYLPGTFSSTEEIVELAKVVAAHGGLYASHIRTEEVGVVGAIEEAITIGERAGCRVHISHLKASGPKAWGLGNDICTAIEQARQRGRTVTADQYPYMASSTALEAMVVPTWAREGGGEQLLARLKDAQTGLRLRDEIKETLEERGGPRRFQIADYDKRPEWAGKTLQELAEETRQAPVDVCVEILKGGGAHVIIFSMSEEDVRLITARPFVATASDGSARQPGDDKPHPRSYGTFARKIADYAHRRGWLPIEQAIRSATGLPADILGLKDRGYVKPGYVADLVVFDIQQLRDHATFQDPHRYATGFRRVYLSGRAAVVDDALTGVLAGRPIRHVSGRAKETQ